MRSKSGNEGNNRSGTSPVRGAISALTAWLVCSGLALAAISGCSSSSTKAGNTTSETSSIQGRTDNTSVSESTPTGSTASKELQTKAKDAGSKREPVWKFVQKSEDTGYLGPESCRECHRERLEECLPTSHFNTCRKPTEERLPRGFAEGANQFQLPGTEVRFEMSRRGEKVLQAAVRNHSGTESRVESTIDLILGAGKSSDEVYLSWHADNTMWELPVAWVYANDCWGASGFDRNSSGDHARALTVRCFECHNTWFEHVQGTLSEYRREGIILGVTCERCHGPGKKHVEYHRRNPSETRSQHILLPSALPRERLMEVCTQCHGNAIRHRGPSLTYRPGERLDDYYRWVKPAHPEDDHVANQIGYMQDSPCFQKSDMTCITCHDPHLTDRPSTGADFHTNCAACHQPEACPKRPELPAEVQGKCVDCHMRKYVKINVNFDLEHDSYVPPTRRSQHRIEVNPVATDEVLLRWHRTQTSSQSATESLALQTKLVNYWMQEAAKCAEVGRYRGAIAAIREGLIVAPEDATLQTELRQYIASQASLDADQSNAEHALRNNQDDVARNLFESVIQRQPGNARVVGKLGMLAAKRGERELAERLLASVSEHDIDDQYGLSMLAWLAMLDKDYSKATKYYEQADYLEPFNTKIHQLWGEALARGGKPIDALRHFEVSLRSDPRNLDAMRSAAKAAMLAQDRELALEYANEAVEVTGQRDLADLKLLVEIQVENKLHADARESVRAMLGLVGRDAGVASEIQNWAKSLGLTP